MLQWFIKFPKFTEFTKFLLYSGKTLLSCNWDFRMNNLQELTVAQRSEQFNDKLFTNLTSSLILTRFPLIHLIDIRKFTLIKLIQTFSPPSPTTEPNFSSFLPGVTLMIHPWPSHSAGFPVMCFPAEFCSIRWKLLICRNRGQILKRLFKNYGIILGSYFASIILKIMFSFRS